MSSPDRHVISQKSFGSHACRRTFHWIRQQFIDVGGTQACPTMSLSLLLHLCRVCCNWYSWDCCSFGRVRDLDLGLLLPVVLANSAVACNSLPFALPAGQARDHETVIPHEWTDKRVAAGSKDACCSFPCPQGQREGEIEAGILSCMSASAIVHKGCQFLDARLLRRCFLVSFESRLVSRSQSILPRSYLGSIVMRAVSHTIVLLDQLYWSITPEDNSCILRLA